MILTWIIIATVLNSLIGLIGVLGFFFTENKLKGFSKYLVSLATGTLIGGAFFHLFPESLEKLSYSKAAGFLVFGFVLFFMIEKGLHWHHCTEEGKCRLRKKKAFVDLILIGDGLHNFIDGLIIAASFIVNIPFGIITTLMIISHEVPQEIGDFGILIYGGLKRKKALLYNFVSQATCIIGGVVLYFLRGFYDISSYLLPLAAGGFLYIASSDLIPELQKEEKNLKTIVIFILGIALMIIFKVIFE